MTRHLVAASALAFSLMSGAAIAHEAPLAAIANPDPILSTARIKDSDDHVIGAVQSVQLDAQGHALGVEVALLDQDSTVLINADRFLYDADSNTLVAPHGLSG